MLIMPTKPEVKPIIPNVVDIDQEIYNAKQKALYHANHIRSLTELIVGEEFSKYDQASREQHVESLLLSETIRCMMVELVKTLEQKKLKG